MATKTSYLNLSKAEITDEILKTLTANNNNFELIDSKAQEIDDKIAEIEKSTGSAEGIIVLEASTDNVIDFNTLTESGIYLIKNSTSGTVNHSPFNSTIIKDVVLVVGKEISAKGTVMPMQNLIGDTNNNTHYSRYFDGANWSSWNRNLSASYISAGTFAGRIQANASAATTLANKQVRNITIQTADLTAGTSTLATGDIVLVYE